MRPYLFISLLALLLFWHGSPARAQVVLPDSYDPADSLLYEGILRATTEMQQGKSDQAIQVLLQLRESYPDEPRLLRLLADQYFSAGDYHHARWCYQTLTEEDSLDMASWLKLAEIASYSQQYGHAYHVLSIVLRIDSLNLKGLMMMAEILDRHKNEGAYRFYDRAFRAYPASQVAAYGLASWYVQSDTPCRAIPICTRILADDSTSIRFSRLKGFAHYKAGESRQAVLQFHQTLALGDTSAFTFKYMGISQYVAADIDGALASLQKAVELDSLDAESHFFLGASLGHTKAQETAMFHLDRSKELMQPDPTALARIYSEKGNLFRLQERYEAAYDSYRQAWEADTLQPMSLYYMASILDNSLHRSEDALADYQHFIERLDRTPLKEDYSSGMPSVRVIVEDRIVSLKEELFFLDR